MGYTIKSITGTDVKVNFDYDNKDQTIDCSGFLDSADSLKAHLAEYEQAYIRGKQQEEVDAQAAELQALIGQTVQTESVEE